MRRAVNGGIERAVPLHPEAGRTLGFVGLGRMGFPMGRLLAEAGCTLRGYDVDPAVRAEFASAVDTTEPGSAVEVARGAEAVFLMLPNSDVVDAVLLGDGLLDALAPGTVLIDMGSSRPARTRELAAAAAERGVPMVDAPVSGGVRGVHQRSLAVMVGGEPEPVRAVRPLLEVFGRTVWHVGPVGAGHALKALNNLLSATHLLVTSEAIIAGQAFGLDPSTMLQVFNASTGRSGSTQVKWPRFMLDRSFDSGFGLALMVKDVRIAVELAQVTGSPAPLGTAALEQWERAAECLEGDADHTEIVRWLEREHDVTGG